jgi:hypothetical protein
MAATPWLAGSALNALALANLSFNAWFGIATRAPMREWNRATAKTA